MSIICGTDLSEASAGVLEVALALAAQRENKTVVLVHVIDPETGGSPEERDEAIEKARAALDAIATSYPTVRAELVAGPPDQTLCGFAETEGADLIVIAARSTGGSLLMLGSTAEKVIARTTVPVVAVRDPAPWLAFAKGERPLRVLLGIDESATCDLGIQWTQALRKHAPVDVVLGAIYYPDDAAAYYGLHARHLVDRDPEIEQLMSRDLLRRFGSDDGQGAVTARVRRGLGRIGDHLLELAKEENVDAIVVGTSQKTGLGRLGSVSTVIVHDATESVVCVPPNATVAQTSVPLLHRALVATDMSSFANRAVPYAFAMAGGEVHLVHVVKEDEDVDESELSRQLYALTPKNARQAVSAHVVRGDDAATALAQTAARLGVDVVCIASHGRSGISRAIVGSVADRLLRATHIPVLVLRPS
ncbi:MAG TPA: universal stress protein [Kofleriaceae bacterium]|jgi:nucleotide-binding universal stress UspA family protein|nr:universal stress protein [Kofleriaceae bacterium]